MWKPPARGRLVQTTWALSPCVATPFRMVSSGAQMPREMRMNVRVFAAAALVAALAVVAVGASGASGGSAANTLTVWLQTDATVRLVRGRRGGERPVQESEPGLGRRRPVPDVGFAPVEVRRYVGRQQGAGRHRDGEHRDDEVHGGRRVPGPVVALVPEPEHVALRAWPRRADTAASCTASRTTRARVSSPIGPTRSSR